MSESDIVALDSPLAGVGESVGGKVLALHTLHTNGFFVPAGFVLTTSFFEKCVNADLTECVHKAQDSIFSNIEAFCHSPRVVVRSSVTAEDGKIRSFAGQFDSYLDVDRAQLLQMIARCACSVDNFRAHQYSDSTSHSERLRIAVLVQEQIEAEVSGVVFSVDPVTGDDSLLVEVVRGTNEQLVQGTTTPDLYRVGRDHTLVEHQLSEEEAVCGFDVVQEVVTTALRIEQLFGHPVDVEWVYAQGQLWIVQSRPITRIQQ